MGRRLFGRRPSRRTKLTSNSKLNLAGSIMMSIREKPVQGNEGGVCRLMDLAGRKDLEPRLPMRKLVPLVYRRRRIKAFPLETESNLLSSCYRLVQFSIFSPFPDRASRVRELSAGGVISDSEEAAVWKKKKESWQTHTAHGFRSPPVNKSSRRRCLQASSR